MKSKLQYILIFCILFIISIYGFYFFKFHGVLSESSQEWSNFGSYIGGSLSPILNFLAFYGIAITFCIQYELLDITKKDLEYNKKNYDDQLENFFNDAIRNDIKSSLNLLSCELDNLLKMKITNDLANDSQIDHLNYTFDYYFISKMNLSFKNSGIIITNKIENLIKMIINSLENYNTFINIKKLKNLETVYTNYESELVLFYKNKYAHLIDFFNIAF